MNPWAGGALILAVVFFSMLLPFATVFLVVAWHDWKAGRWDREHIWIPVEPDGLSGGYWMPKTKGGK